MSDDKELLELAFEIRKWIGLLADWSLAISAFCIGYLYGRWRGE